MTNKRFQQIILIILTLLLGISISYVVKEEISVRNSQSKLNNEKFMKSENRHKSGSKESLSIQDKPKIFFERSLNDAFKVINKKDFSSDPVMKGPMYQAVALTFNPMGGNFNSLSGTDITYNIDGNSVTGFGTINVHQVTKLNGQEGTNKSNSKMDNDVAHNVLVKMKIHNGKYKVTKIEFGQIKQEDNQNETTK
ncbi:hypothetical protein IV73_GL001075 [Weissella kandleri]|uniref:Uncharacterized protein n=1 Tax=Weissella kandleri TaxID=1616 RepID=A0A0R2JBY4_9LACO|nr:hypothetical protein [Weissella kandleri]KRN74798.1 hypothetical protein IV73_GL001075 [Weissella kandleri]